MRARTLSLWLAGAVPWIAYVFTCSAHAYWLDSGEFVAAAVRLDIAHPPGHPLTALYGKAWSLVPLGPLPLRIAIGQAFATALACVLACLASEAILRRQGVAASWRWPCALLGTWISAFTYGLWFQAVRPEVYALQTACTALILERLLAFEAQPAHAARHAGPVCLALGLGLANHHFTALLLAPALLVPLARLLVPRVRGRVLALGVALGGLGLATYAYLPLRAAGPLPVNLGRPDDLARFLWVVSARVYTQVVGTDAPQPLSERFADVAVLLVESFGAVPLAAAAVGAYVLLRQGATRRQGVILLLLIVPNLAARAWLGPVRSNPDVLGYFGTSFLAIGCLVACAAGAIAVQLGEHAGRAQRSLERAAVALPALALLLLPGSAARSTLARFTATDTFDDARVRSLPPRSVVVETMPQTVFRHWELDAVERARPDLAQLPVPFLTHPGMLDTLLEHQPRLRQVALGYLEQDRLRPGDLAAQAHGQPTWLELDLRVPPQAYSLLTPAHLLHRCDAQPSDATHLKRELASTYADLYARLGGQVRETETLRQLLAIHYLDAVHFAARGQLELARIELANARHLAPTDNHVQALTTTLGDGSR
jgi:hypothetical protein